MISATTASELRVETGEQILKALKILNIQEKRTLCDSNLIRDIGRSVKMCQHGAREDEYNLQRTEVRQRHNAARIVARLAALEAEQARLEARVGRLEAKISSIRKVTRAIFTLCLLILAYNLLK